MRTANPFQIIIITVFTTTLVQVSLAQGGSNDKDLKDYYEALYNAYKDHKVAWDCNVGHEENDDEHHKWGTKKSLEYLSEKMPMKKLKHGEKGNNREKLRVFLARVGYLKAPGSLVFMNKQTDTLRLTGCGENAFWKMQGERGVDQDFHQTGKDLKTQAPNAANYIHKYYCIKSKECSHVFYVITRPLPELPIGVELRNEDDMEKETAFGQKPTYWLNCGLPYCNIKTCKVGKTTTDANRRAYPPYTFSWNLKSRASDTDNDKVTGMAKASKKAGHYLTEITTSTKLNNDKDKGHKMKVLFEQKVRKSKEDDIIEADSYETAKDDLWINSFGEEDLSGKTRKDFHFNSRIVITTADAKIHSGLYECIIEDANGVVSTPSVFTSDREWMEYEGRTNLYVISPFYLIVCLGGGIGCIAAVTLIILLCPKKMEYDDGTRYTKEELVAPENKKTPKTETVSNMDVAGAAGSTDPSSQTLKTSKTEKTLGEAE